MQLLWQTDLSASHWSSKTSSPLHPLSSWKWTFKEVPWGTGGKWRHGQEQGSPPAAFAALLPSAPSSYPHLIMLCFLLLFLFLSLDFIFILPPVSIPPPTSLRFIFIPITLSPPSPTPLCILQYVFSVPFILLFLLLPAPPLSLHSPLPPPPPQPLLTAPPCIVSVVVEELVFPANCLHSWRAFHSSALTESDSLSSLHTPPRVIPFPF